MHNQMISLGEDRLTLEKLIEAIKNPNRIVFPTSSKRKMLRSQGVIEKIIKEGKPIYGVTTGVGSLQDRRISRKRLLELQRNILRSHSTGVGEPLDEEVVKAILVLRAHTLAIGHSGVRTVVVDRIIDLLKRDIIPVVPEKGSVGASGDLAPLAHIALVLMGEGEVFYNGRRRRASGILRKLGIPPLTLEIKEGISLINGTQVTLAVLSVTLWKALRLLSKSDYISAMSVYALSGNKTPFDERIASLRPHRAVIETSRRLTKLLGSGYKPGGDRVQDAYSLRCIPQVHGAIKGLLSFIRETIEIEMNSVTDNPIVFPENVDILSGGNFHGQPLAFAGDILSMGLTSLSSISERRTFRLLSSSLSGLSPYLTRESGVSSGFMMWQVTQASLVSMNKAMSHPCSCDSIPTSDNQEDFVSMSMNAALKAKEILKNTEDVLAIELLCALQGVHLRGEVGLSPALKKIYRELREKIPPLKKDRTMEKDLENVKNWLTSDQNSS